MGGQHGSKAAAGRICMLLMQMSSDGRCPAPPSCASGLSLPCDMAAPPALAHVLPLQLQALVPLPCRPQQPAVTVAPH